MEKLEKMEETFVAFKKEALLRKKKILTGEFGAKEFMDWLYKQSSIIITLTE